MPPKKRKRQSNGGDWSVDRSGRWRDSRGKFASKAALLDRVSLLGPDEAARMLRAAARRVEGKAKRSDEYVVQANFDGVGWRTLSSSYGLRAALNQGATFVDKVLPLRLGIYVRETESGKAKRLRRNGERPTPKIVGFEVKRVGKKGPRRKKRRA